MKQTKKSFLRLITNRPNSFSVMGVIIVLIGIISGLFLYYQTNQISSAAEIGRDFDKNINSLLTSVSLAGIRFTNLLEGNSDIDLQKDIYSQLDNADSLCINVDNGGPNGQFMLPPDFGSNANPPIISLCSQLKTLRELIQQRWLAHQTGQPDTQKSAFEISLQKIIEQIQSFSGVTAPGIQAAEAETRRTNLELSIGLAGIFFFIALIIYLTQRSLTAKTKKIQAEMDLSTRLNTALDTERNLVNTLIDNIPDAIFSKDSQCNFVVANATAARLLGVENKDTIIGKTESEFFPKEIADRIIADDTHVLTTGEKILDRQEIISDVTTGKLHWQQTTKIPLRDSQDQIYGLVGISRDITKEKETEEALQKANTNLTLGIASLEQSSRETEQLSEMVDLLQACPNTEEACIVIADQLSKFFPEDSGMLYLTHASRNILERVAAWGSPLPDSTVFKPDDCWALRRGRMHIVEENSNPTTLPIEHNHSLICPHITISGPADYLCVPLVAQGEALGLLHLRHLITPGQEKNNAKEWYDHLKRSRIHTIVDSLSLALANLILRSSLRQQSIRDPLTGMFNRRYLEETLDREILRAGRNQQTVGVIMLDIDHFKLFNDTYGHQAGDAMLTALGHFFSTHVRGEDIACRYGGEEFILLMPGASLEITKQRAEELLEKVRFVNVTFQGQSLRTITLSMGISIFPQNGSNGEALVQRADQALYRAKAAGRDQVVVA